MFDEILGLPAHPLIIHAAVMLTPMLAVASVVYALVPRFRPQVAWAVVLLAIGAPASVFAARQSGESLKQARFATVEGPLAEQIDTHAGFALPLLLCTLGLGVAALALVYLTRAERFGRPLVLVASAATVVLAVAASYYVFRAGDSGAQAVWSL